MRLLKCAGILLLQMITVWVLAVIIRRYAIEQFPRCPTFIWNSILILLPIVAAFTAYTVVFCPSKSSGRTAFRLLVTLAVALVFTSASTVASVAVLNITDEWFEDRFKTIVSEKLEQDARFGQKRITAYLTFDEHSLVYLSVYSAYDTEHDRLAMERLLQSVFVPYRVKPELRFIHELIVETR